MARYSGFPFSFTIAGPSTITLRQLDGYTLNTAAVNDAITPAGAVDRAQIGLSSAMPGATLETRDLLTVFTNVSPSTCLAFTDGALRFQKRAEASTFESSAAHEAVDIAKGVLYVGNVSAAQQDAQGASMSVIAAALYDGTNIPLDRTTNADFSGVSSPTFTSRYYLGPIYHNGTAIPNIERVSIDFGINYSRKGFGGSTYPTEGSIVTRNPVITFTSTAIAIDAAVSMFLRSLAGTIAVYLQAGVAGSDRVSAASSSHIKLSATSGAWTTDSMSVSANDDGTVNLSVMPTSAMAVATNSAIP